MELIPEDHGLVQLNACSCALSYEDEPVAGEVLVAKLDHGGSHLVAFQVTSGQADINIFFRDLIRKGVLIIRNIKSGRIVRNLSLNRLRWKTEQKRNCDAEVLLSEIADCVPAYEDVEHAAKR